MHAKNVKTRQEMDVDGSMDCARGRCKYFCDRGVDAELENTSRWTAEIPTVAFITVACIIHMYMYFIRAL